MKKIKFESSDHIWDHKLAGTRVASHPAQKFQKLDSMPSVSCFPLLKIVQIFARPETQLRAWSRPEPGEIWQNSVITREKEPILAGWGDTSNIIMLIL